MAEEAPELQKSLKSRHMTMISLAVVLAAFRFKTRAERTTSAVPVRAS